MGEQADIQLGPPEVIESPVLRFVGLARRHDQPASPHIPGQWDEFNALGLMGDGDGEAFGLCYDMDEDGSMSYLCSVKVSELAPEHEELDHMTIPPQTYAVFHHGGHITEIGEVWKTIFSSALPEAGLEPTGGPDFERYGPEFDPATGQGGYDIWVAVQSRE